jgi:hypothetical protein
MVNVTNKTQTRKFFDGCVIVEYVYTIITHTIE